MKTVRKTFTTLFVTVLLVALSLLLTVLLGAACSNKVTLRFQTDGGTYLPSVEGNVGADYEKPVEPHKEGFYFAGWYLSADFSGGQEELPEVMPAESTTFYAKFLPCPVLTLDAAGGSLEQTEYTVKPGAPLSEILGAAPKREGLEFGGWFEGEKLFGADERMPDGDLFLTARYLAHYEANVYLQSADDPDEFLFSGDLSVSGSDWEGTVVTAAPPELDHFLLTERKGEESMTLAAGKNVVEFYLAREEVTLRYEPNVPGQSGRAVVSRFGAHETLEKAPCEREGYVFFGWSEVPGGDADKRYAPGSQVSLDADLTLYGAWAKVYQSARGGGTLAVGECETNGERRAVYERGDLRAEGVFRTSDKMFVSEGLCGRLDEHERFLPDDSGEYAGFSLKEMRADKSKFGTLTLRFGEGKAVYLLGKDRFEGDYTYVYDEDEGKYTGKYSFSADGLSFLFGLTEDAFLRQGEETGEYAAYDPLTDTFDLTETLVLDGFGGAVLREDSRALEGTYEGYGGSEWEAAFQGLSLRFLVGSREWLSDGESFARENGFIRYRADLAGTFTGDAGVLCLDGYGLSGRFEGAGGTFEGRFTKDGVLVELDSSPKFRFTLNGQSFSLTGEEQGTYSGERGALLLDGAKRAKLSSSSGAVLAEGTYLPAGEREWNFVSDKTQFRFRLDGDRYEVYSELIGGSFKAFYGPCLVLDGYGGGFYYSEARATTEITVGYCDGTYLEAVSPDFVTLSGSLTFRVDYEKRRVERIQREEAGSYAGETPEELLFLDGDGRGVLCGKAGGYEYDEDTRQVRFEAEGETAVLLLTQKNGRARYVAFDRAGVFGGEGTLTLDGFGHAQYESETESFSAEYVLCGDVAEIAREGELLRFLLGEGTFELTAYDRYAAADGGRDLYVRTDGASAFFRGEEDESFLCAREGDVLSSAEGEYLLSEGRYFRYDEALAVVYPVGNGAELRADGCGTGTYVLDDVSYFGNVTAEDGLIVFSSADLPSPSGMLAFSLSEGTLTPLGAEYGNYAPAGGGEHSLRMLGNGSARYFADGTWRDAVYEPFGGENEFTLTAGKESFRFRIARENGAPVYRVFDEALAAYAGEYSSEEGTLHIDGYGIVLSDRSGERVLSFVRGEEKLIVAECGGVPALFELGGETFAVRALEVRFSVL